jgi:hypothetical protein
MREIMHMELRSEKDGWSLAFQDGFVQLIQVEFRLGMFLSDASGTAKLYVETPCRLKGLDADMPLTPEHSSSLAPALSLFNAQVIDAAIQKTGHLRVRFGDGRSLEVDPDDAYEAWQLGCSVGLFVCSPGGEVAFFEESDQNMRMKT